VTSTIGSRHGNVEPANFLASCNKYELLLVLSLVDISSEACNKKEGGGAGERSTRPGLGCKCKHIVEPACSDALKA
jgi:hypothetical protein